MKSTCLFLLVPMMITGCKDKTIRTEYLSNISVIREIHHNPLSDTISLPSPGDSLTAAIAAQKSLPVLPVSSALRYHIIVASFTATEKNKAEDKAAQLRSQGYPSSLLPASQRYRVSIESFASEAAANAALDKYKKITGREDIWILKTKE